MAISKLLISLMFTSWDCARNLEHMERIERDTGNRTHNLLSVTRQSKLDLNDNQLILHLLIHGKYQKGKTNVLVASLTQNITLTQVTKKDQNRFLAKNLTKKKKIMVIESKQLISWDQLSEFSF